MKISKLFHWLYATLMFFPLIALPIFGIFAHRHSLTSPVTRVEPQPVYYESNDVVDSSSFVSGNAYLWTDNFVAPNTWTSNFTIATFKTTDNVLELQPNFDTDILSLAFANNNRLLYLTDGHGHFFNINNATLWLVYVDTRDVSGLNYLSSYFEEYDTAIKGYQDVTITEDKGVSIVVPVPTHYTLRQNVINGYAYNTEHWVNNGSEVDTLEYYVSRHELFFDTASDYSVFYNTALVNINHNDIIYFTYEVSGDLVGGNAHAFSIEYVNNDDIYFEDGTHDVTKGKHSYYYQYLGNDGDDMFLMFSTSIEGEYYFRNIQMFNLTEIFGSGNEPTKEEFENILTKEYYDYDTDYDVIYGTHDVVYDDSDVMSQFTYQIYNLEDKYLNFDNVFNFRDLYNWINLTAFDGYAPIYFTMVWHLLTYWLLVSLFWLIFDVLMYIPNLAHRWLDRGAIE